MDASSVFDWVNSLTLIGWALMIFTPKWTYTQKMVKGLILPSVLSVFYLVFIFSGEYLKVPDVSSLAEIRKLFSSDFLLLAGWTHYLAFDLLVGSWILVRAQKVGLSHWVTAPALFLTFVMGPFGLIFFLIGYLAKEKHLPEL